MHLATFLTAACIVSCHLPLGCPACPSECVCMPAYQNVMCSSVTNAFNSYASSIPAWTSRLILMCQPLLSASGRPQAIGPSLSGLSAGVFRRFSELRDVTVRDCPIAALPGELFAFLPRLETIMLDNLPLASLPAGLVRGSPRLRELVVLRSPEYRAQPPGLFADSPGPRLLRMVGTGLKGEALANLLASLSPGGIADLELKMAADPPLTLPAAVFARFNLTNLSLSSNGIQDFAFLPATGSASITLSYNPVPSGRLTLTPSGRPNQLVATLHLEHMGLAEIPEGLAAAFPNLAELYLATNAISELAPDRLEYLSQLVKLDLSGNQIQSLSNWRRLQPLLSSILYRDRVYAQVYLADNPIHCNCELGWIYDSPVLSTTLFNNLACRSGLFAGELLARLQRHQLRCLRPSAPAVRVLAGNSSGGEAGVTVHLAPGQNVTLACNSRGDPAPELAWRWVPAGEPPAPPQELLRSKPSRDFAALTTVLLLGVIHDGRLPSGRHRLECVASSPYFAETSSNVTLVVWGSVTTTPDTSRPPGTVGTPRSIVNCGISHRSWLPAVVTSAAAALLALHFQRQLLLGSDIAYDLR